jgi:hypothetical protein
MPSFITFSIQSLLLRSEPAHLFLFYRAVSLAWGRKAYCKAREPLFWTDRQPTAEELKYSCNRARQRQRPTNNLLKVWQNLAIFGGRPIGAAVETLLTIVVNQQSSVSPIVVFFVAAAISIKM